MIQSQELEGTEYERRFCAIKRERQESRSVEKKFLTL